MGTYFWDITPTWPFDHMAIHSLFYANRGLAPKSDNCSRSQAIFLEKAKNGRFHAG